MYDVGDVMKGHNKSEREQGIANEAQSREQAVLRTYRNALLKIRDSNSNLEVIKSIASNALRIEGK